MGDMTKFNSAIEYYIFNVLLICLLISEIFIFFYTRSKQNRTEKNNNITHLDKDDDKRE